jgi:lysine-N-methylase
MSTSKADVNKSAPKAAPLADGINRPTYAAAFRCIGASCEDTCCRGWAIPLDKATYNQYQKFPPGKLGSVVSQYVSINATPGAPDAVFARILPTSPPTSPVTFPVTSSGACPFFTTDNLCAVQKEYGPGLLSATCSAYPRALNLVEGVLEGALTLSCPEAARNVLLVPDSTDAAGNLSSGEFRTDTALRLGRNGSSATYKPYRHFHAIRSLLIDIVKHRSRPLWQRLVLIGSLCKSLDHVTAEYEDKEVPAILADHRQTLQQLGHDSLRASLQAIPVQPGLKLGVVLKLTDARVQDKESGSRFMDVFWSFIEGIGSGTDTAGKDDVQRYLLAKQTYHDPFFAKSPFILENYLVNYIFQNLFPFGHEATSRFKPRSIFEEYILLATQFAWVDTLLVGVAGHYREAFGEEHVVKVVQSFSRAVEHNPYISTSINEFMAHLQMDNLEGMAVMLRS